jgi:flagellar hook-length control protein FliK
MVRGEQIPLTRGAVEAGAKQILGSRMESRTPEIARTLVDQVIKALQLEVKGPVSEMRLKLEPESLGELALRVRVEEGKMQARIEVSQPAVKAVIEGNLPQLRQALATQGIQMDRIDITTQDRSLSRGTSDGSGGRERRRGQKEGEATIEETSIQGARMLGYNTIELTM